MFVENEREKEREERERERERKREEKKDRVSGGRERRLREKGGNKNKVGKKIYLWEFSSRICLNALT